MPTMFVMKGGPDPLSRAAKVIAACEGARENKKRHARERALRRSLEANRRALEKSVDALKKDLEEIHSWKVKTG